MRGFLIVLLLFIAPTAFSADCVDSEQASRVFEKYLDDSYDDVVIEQLGDICRLYPYGEGNIRLAGFYHVKDSDQVRIDIYDILGRKVHRLIDRRLESGAHKFKWDASGQASGVYFYRLFANDK